MNLTHFSDADLGRLHSTVMQSVLRETASARGSANPIDDPEIRIETHDVIRTLSTHGTGRLLYSIVAEQYRRQQVTTTAPPAIVTRNESRNCVPEPELSVPPAMAGLICTGISLLMAAISAGAFVYFSGLHQEGERTATYQQLRGAAKTAARSPFEEGGVQDSLVGIWKSLGMEHQACSRGRRTEDPSTLHHRCCFFWGYWLGTRQRPDIRRQRFDSHRGLC